MQLGFLIRIPVSSKKYVFIVILKLKKLINFSGEDVIRIVQKLVDIGILVVLFKKFSSEYWCTTLVASTSDDFIILKNSDQNSGWKCS